VLEPWQPSAGAMAAQCWSHGSPVLESWPLETSNSYIMPVYSRQQIIVPLAEPTAVTTK